MEVHEYLRRHPPEKMTVAEVWSEMDSVWDALGLDNRKPFTGQPVSQFYAHPVWVLNGLFTAVDPESVQHRTCIARYVVETLKPASVADYGGGIGELAHQISVASGDRIPIDIIEPYPSQVGIERAARHPRVTYRPEFAAPYDLVVAQDVLEHTEDPIGVALQMIEATRMGGHLIFANCFYPVIKCHLPGTFYLRHTFRHVMRPAGLDFVCRIPGAWHAECFRRVRPIDRDAVTSTDRLMRVCGPPLNLGVAAARIPVRAAKWMVRKALRA
jgi:2-polyprenyl-6-hydroxyphenyl methylase/3-demethylubiquinone-9 3-methyltransferase